VHYDPMLAKIIAQGPDRATALAALDRALAETELLGVEHNTGFLRRVLAVRDFVSGSYTTRLIEEAGDTLVPGPEDLGALVAAFALRLTNRSEGPWGASDGFRLNQAAALALELTCEQRRVAVVLKEDSRTGVRTALVDDHVYDLVDLGSTTERVRLLAGGIRIDAAVRVEGSVVHVARFGGVERWQLPEERQDLQDAAPGERVAAPMPGQVIEVAVRVGDWVEPGALLLVVEAMKMEHVLRAPRAGRVAAIACAAGDRVQEGVELVQLEDDVAPATDQQSE
jgi:acetyl/propionyl-CoA carboxylase alpha subunit